MKYYISICIMLTCIPKNNNANPLDLNRVNLDELTRAIENEANLAVHYKPREDNSDIYPEFVKDTTSYYGQFDFIVVGAGSAGAIVAKRLSEHRFRTLLLEAGGDQYNLTEIPNIYKNFQMTDNNWGYMTTSQKYSSQAMIHQQCKYPRGKSLGGSSAINGMVYARGNSHDQDFWADFGISGWSWKDTLPYFERLENYENIYGDSGYHGWDGPVHLDYVRPNSILIDYFLKANEEMYRITDDYNGKIQLAAGKIQTTKHKGRRMSTNRAYLSEYNKKYLTIETNAYVHKIIITNKTAEGVEFVKNHQNFCAMVKKEVIISAGAINSPQLLMLSGIGPQEELHRHKIQIVADLPVGKNMKDHIGFVGVRFESNLTLTDRNKPLRSHAWDYLSEVGKLSDNELQGVVFLSNKGNLTYPDLEILLVPSGRSPFPDLNEYNLNEESRKIFTPSDEQIDYVFRSIVLLLHPHSKGTVTLQSKNPRDFPIINPNGLSDPRDAETLYESIVYIKSLMKTKPFKEIDAKIMKLVLPACEGYIYDSRDYWICMIKQMSHTIYHPIGTCVMGRKGSSVVDSQLRVHGIKGLRVADASIVPMTNSGHTNALAMMIGEKAADIIRTSRALL